MKDMTLQSCATAAQYLERVQNDIDALKNFPPTMFYGIGLDEFWKPILALGNFALMSIEQQVKKTAAEYGL